MDASSSIQNHYNYSDLRKPAPSLKAARFMDTVVFDIETMGDREKTLEYMEPYPDFVEPKYGNLKDPEKRSLLREQKYKEWEEGEPAWIAKQHDKSALSPVTGRVVAIGYLFPYGNEGDESLWDQIQIEGLTSSGNHDLQEIAMLNNFWKVCRCSLGGYGHLIGHNITGFDLQFLIKRSWQLGVKVYSGIFSGRYFNQYVIDTMKIWALGEYNKFISLDKLSKILGVGSKMANYEATQFAEDWLRGDKDTAEFYLKTDLDLAFKCYQKMYS